MKKFKLALVILLSLSIAQPVLANGKMGPPAAKASIEKTESNSFVRWFMGWF